MTKYEITNAITMHDITRSLSPKKMSSLGLLIGTRVPGSGKNYPIPGNSLPKIIPEVSAK